LNGITALDGNAVLMADSFLGGIWSLDIHTGRKKLLFSDEWYGGGSNRDKWHSRSTRIVVLLEFSKGNV
jgi:hypothetical protein